MGRVPETAPIHRAPPRWLRASDGPRRPRLASPRRPAILRFPKPRAWETFPERFTDLNCKTGKTFRICGARGTARSRCASARPSSLLRAPWALPGSSSHSCTPTSPPCTGVTPSPLTTPPAHLHLPPVPQHPDTRVGVPPPGSPSSRPHCPPGPAVFVAQRTGKQPGARFRVRPGGEERGGRGGTGVGDQARPRAGTAGGGGRGGGAGPAWGSAGSSPAASKSGGGTAKSPTCLEPRESHLSGGGWGVLFQEPRGPLRGPYAPGPASRLSAPPPPSDQ